MSANEPLTVDCRTCVARDTDACADCLVSFICDRRPDEAVVFEIDELRSMRLLAGAGLLPELRHRPRSA
jgi:hypothetical protein